MLTLRYGFSTWGDSCDKQPYSPGIGALGFSPNYTSALSQTDVFPELLFDDVVDVGGWGAIPNRWNSPYTFNATLSKLWGNHSLKAGADLRKLGVDTVSATLMGGSFTFDERFSGNNGVGGHELASVLLGAPVSGSVPLQRRPVRVVHQVLRRLHPGRLAGQPEAHRELRRAARTRRRPARGREPAGGGLRRVGGQPVERDRAQDRLARRPDLNGGLIFAGVDGAPEEQGDPAAVKIAPRGGFSYSLNNNTVLRGGYGLFYAPWNYTRGQHGQAGFTRDTTHEPVRPRDRGAAHVAGQPVPVGADRADRQQPGLLTNAGGTIRYVDQNKGNPKVHQYSFDIQRELPGNMAVTDRLRRRDRTRHRLLRHRSGLSGTEAININQIDPEVARRAFPGPNGTWDAAALRANVANPFFGIPGTGEFGTRHDDPGRPAAAAVPAVRRHPASTKRPTAGAASTTPGRSWSRSAPPAGGAAGSATRWSQSKDNQFGQGSTYQTGTVLPQNNYDLDAEYGVSAFDSPHRIILAPIMKFPNSGRGGIAGLFLDGWNASAVVELVSGSPLNAIMSASASDTNLGLFGGRQRPNLVGDPNTDGSDTDRVIYEGNDDARYFDRAAYANPGVGTFRRRPAHQRRRPLPVQTEHRPGDRQGHDAVRQPRRTGPVRDPEPDQHAEVPRHRLEPGRYHDVRPDHAAGRVHADLAAQLPLHVLTPAAGG